VLETMTQPSMTRKESSAKDCLGLGEQFSEFVILASQPFTKRNLDRFGATWLLDHSKTVYLVDISLIVWGKLAVETEEPDAVAGVRRPATWEDLESLLARVGPRSLVIPYHLVQDAMPLVRMIAKHALHTLLYECVIRTPASMSLGRLIASKLQRLVSNPRVLLRNARKRLAAAGVTVDYLVLTGGDCEARPHRWFVSDARQTITSHAYDYVVWDAAEVHVQPGPYIVFLDQAYPDHPDWVQLWGINPFKREIYYPEIERFLRHLSDCYGMPVLVALHPRSPSADPKPYQGFQTFRDRTASLVKGAQLVVAHDSTAVSFAVLSRKPLLFVECEERRRLIHLGNRTRTLSQVLGAPVTDMRGGRVPDLDSLRVDDSKYVSYETMYIRHSGCNGIPVWDRVFGSSGNSRSALS